MYLRSCLTQEAANAIASLANTIFNYPVAWGQYNQAAKIVGNHLKALFDVSPLQRPSYQDLQSYLNKIEIKR